MIFRFALKTLAESVGATYGSSVLAYSVAVGLILLIGDHRWIDVILTSPTFLLPVVAGALLAYLFRNHLSNTSYFAWIVPGVLFLGAFLEVVRSPFAIPYATSSEVWNALFGTDCRASECLYEVLFTSPFLSAVSYSVSSACIRAAKRSRVQAGENGATRAVARF